MIPTLISVLRFAASGFMGALLVGGGLTLVFATGLTILVENALDYGVQQFTNVPSDILQLALLTGVGEAMSIIGAALVTRSTIMAASNFLGVRRT